VTGAEVELQVVVTDAREAGGGGKVGFHIGVVQVGVDGAAKVQHAEARTHKVKLSLKPVAASGPSVTPTPGPPSRPAAVLISDDK
jgi:hypothetical protein